MGQIMHLGDGRANVARTRVLKVKSNAHPKRALVLGGGGIAGASFEIGALLALNDVFKDFTASDFDIYVGTSAGAFLCACLANGITPEDFARSQIGVPPDHVPRIRRKEILKPISHRAVRGATAWAKGLSHTTRQVARSGLSTSMIDVFFSIAGDMGSSMYTTDGVSSYLAKLFDFGGRSDEFSELKKQLFVTATDIDTGERVVFGAEGMRQAKISEAAAASAAIPVIYEPVRIGNREYLDGGLTSPTNIDIALDQGADFVVVINPLIPYLHDPSYLLRGFETPIRHLSEGGMGRLIAQVFRIMARSQLDKELELIRARTNANVLVVEPRRDAEHLFVFNLMDYGAREQMAKDAFEQVAVDLVTHLPALRRFCSKAGIGLSKGRVLQQLKSVVSGGTVRDLLNQKDSA